MPPRSRTKHIFLPWLSLRDVLATTSGALDRVLTEGKGGYARLAALFVWLIVLWHVYVPIHELAHAGACVLGGGTVTELAIDAQYGGKLLARVFPFVVAESEYAGRLTGFSVPNAWAYAFVDFAPFILSLFGVTLLELARRRGTAWLLSGGFILAFVPAISLTGDYYEAASLVTSRIAEFASSGVPEGMLVSDDVFRLFDELATAGLLNAVTIVSVMAGLALAAYLVLLTLALQLALSQKLLGPNPTLTVPGNGGAADANTVDG